MPAQYFTVNPMAKRARKLGKAYLRKQVKDPVVRDKLTPRYAVGCKRPGFHNTYLSTFNRDNVSLVTEPIDKITGSGVATADGDAHDVDVLILATGFKVMDLDSVLTYRGHRPRRPVAGRVLGRAPAAGLRRRQHPGLPELLHRVRAVRLRRLVVLRAHRVADATTSCAASSTRRRRAPPGSR